MQKLKDIIYDKNDLLVALFIILIASAIMFNRIDAILSYPSAVAASNATVNKGSAVNTGVTSKPASTSEGALVNANSKDGNTSMSNPSSGAISGDSPAQNVVNYSIYVEPGASASKIADLVLSVKLIQTKEEFLQAVDNSGLSGKLKSGTFIIPSNANLDTVIQILTN